MTKPLMPKATAIWLIDNTALTFQQIADFCNLHIIEIESFANDVSLNQMQGFDPLASLQLTSDEIKRCEQDPNAKLQLNNRSLNTEQSKQLLKMKYTPKIKRQDKPDAIFWLIKYYPELSDQEISKLLGTTKKTVHSIRNKTHRNIRNITARNPVTLGLCSENDLTFVISKLSRE